MASDYPEQPLEEVADLSGGFAFKSGDYSPDGRFVLRTLNIDDDGSIHRKDAAFLPLEKCDQYKRFELQEHDTLFVMVGATLGKVGYVRRESLPALLNQNMWRIRGREGLCDKRYLQYAFRHTVAQRLGWASGSARDFVRRDDYRTMKIPVPPLQEQKRIAHILGTLDDKIELNRRMNATLEAMARTLFQSWFVNFDPVRRNSEGGAKRPEDSLFPDSLEDSAIGEIPIGWEVCSLSKKIELLSGGTPKTSEPTYWDGDVPWYSVRDAPTETDVWVIQTDKSVTEQGIANSAAKICPEKTTIISARGTVGKLALTGVPMAMNQSCYGIRGISGYGDFFAYYLVREATVRLQQNAHGSVFDTITTRTFESLDCVFPNKELTIAFDKAVEPLLSKIRANLHQSHTLATLRDTLLPKLLAGEVQAPKAK